MYTETIETTKKAIEIIDQEMMNAIYKLMISHLFN